MPTPRHNNIGERPTNDQGHADPAEVVTAAHAGSEYFIKLLTRGRPAWFRTGACHGTGVIFHSDARAEIRASLQLCGVCEIREPCRQYADEMADQFGIWGGETAPARKARWRAAAARSRTPDCPAPGQ
jgi:hypothetical protein